MKCAPPPAPLKSHISVWHLQSDCCRFNIPPWLSIQSYDFDINVMLISVTRFTVCLSFAFFLQFPKWQPVTRPPGDWVRVWTSPHASTTTNAIFVQNKQEICSQRFYTNMLWEWVVEGRLCMPLLTIRAQAPHYTLHNCKNASKSTD